MGSGALIPPERNYRQQLKVYESQTRERVFTACTDFALIPNSE